MNRFISVVLYILVAIEVVLILLPITFLHKFGLLFLVVISFEMALSGGVGFAVQFFAMLFAFLLLPGYGLYSLWWLVIYHRKISLKKIPRFIWGGLIAGGLSAFYIIFQGVQSGLGTRIPLSLQGDMAFLIVVSFGPLLLTFTLLAIMLQWKELLRKH